jgi:hypothetical protein
MSQPAVHNLTPFALEPIFTLDEQCRPVLVAVVKGTYAIGTDGQLSIAEKQIPVTVSGEHYGEPGSSSYKYEPESAIRKLTTDIVLIGHAYAPHSNATESRVSLRVGGCEKTLKVVGDRQWVRVLGMISATPPEPFERMPLVYERAFGGWDRTDVDPARHTFEPRNPVGAGFVARGRNFEEGLPLPNLEDPRHPIRGYGDTPPPAGFGFLAPDWQPRAAYAGTYDDVWRQSRMPLLPLDFDPRFFNAASPGLVAEGFLRGDERVLIEGASPSRRLLFQLPAVPPPVVRVGLVGHNWQFLSTQLDTVIINTDENLLFLLWRTSLSLRSGPDDVVSIKAQPKGFTPRVKR